MPWQETSPMKQRKEFLDVYLRSNEARHWSVYFGGATHRAPHPQEDDTALHAWRPLIAHPVPIHHLLPMSLNADVDTTAYGGTLPETSAL